MNQKYVVKLTDEQIKHLEKLITSGTSPARMLTRARILLKSDQSENGPNWSYEKIAEAFDVSEMLIRDVRKRFAEAGFEAALQRKKPDREYEHSLDGEAEAHLIALACSQPPEGQKRWTLRLLKRAMQERMYVQTVSHETIRTTLKKKEIKPWLKEQWCIPPKEDAAFVCNMEDVLEVYTRPYDPKRPLICMDEMPKQLLADTRAPTLVQAGQPAREDYEYQRNGVTDLFMLFEPLQGKRYVRVTEQRRRVEWAQVMKYLADELYPEAEQIVIVMDNLNTHTPSAFYLVYTPEEARRLIQRFEFHFTPKHGSWLNMAEIELSALARQCLDRRLPDIETVTHEVQAWQDQRNSEVVKVHWQFTTADARIKLKHLYPRIQI
ncbi:MAG: IS630 family transposase [Desulfobulbaceae bacterium]|nr:IS630 family transposase [Desulfobulbaceae bacterium]